MIDRYFEIRDDIEEGDMIALGHETTFWSRLIKRFTKSHITHVGYVVKMSSDSGAGEFTLMLAEAAAEGMTLSRLRDVLEKYDADGGDAWWCPIKRDLDWQVVDASKFLLGHIESRTKYGVMQAVKSAFDPKRRGKGFMTNDDSDHVLMCSSAVAFAYEAGGLIPEIMNCAEATPIDVCMLDIFEDNVQLYGENEIRDYGTVDPKKWKV